MKNIWIKFWRHFGFYTRPIPMAGIYGVSKDGCYLVLNSEGELVKSHKLDDSKGKAP